MTEGDRQGIGGVVGSGQAGKGEQGLDHAGDLVLGRAAVAAHRALDLLGGVGRAGHPALAGGEHDDPPSLAHGKGAAHVLSEVEILEGHGVRLVLVDEVDDGTVDDGQPTLGGKPRARLHNPSVQGRQPSAASRHHAVSGVGGSRVDSEHDHHAGDSAPRTGRLP